MKPIKINDEKSTVLNPLYVKKTYIEKNDYEDSNVCVCILLDDEYNSTYTRMFSDENEARAFFDYVVDCLS